MRGSPRPKHTNKKWRQNNYYPFGLKHQGYNELPGAGYKYKFLNKEYEDSFALNITETDFRHYDSALGRFNVMDMLSELAYDHTPYRYGFNNPVFWQDASGLFESRDDAQQWINRWGLSGAEISYNWGKGYYEILNEGVSFYQQGEDIIRTMYSWSDSGGMTISYDTIKGGAGNGTGSFLNAFFKFMETGGMFSITGVMKDDPGFKMNSRKRSAVDVSMNYDQVFNPAATSLMAGKNWISRLKDWLGGMDTRASNVSEGLNRSEAKETFYYETYGILPHTWENRFVLIPTTRSVHMTPTDYNNTDWNLRKIHDSIKAVETVKTNDITKYYK